ncbi:hypothetical protein QRD02_08595 [Aequorivita sp. SDUM287046]|uniref:Metal-dependent HD superfamily phosphohydrolase n=1 Tax=Aequorivita aurantiaca TaxID=3053356 RepID=A0ABT8DGE0_9FLAO|nr:hypothetical protein [Aequorivita aurantiaca]MDN3724440.1 hypothetical protein [Aequorivita aurantiaca]
MKTDIRKIFTHLCQKYTSNQPIVQGLWTELNQCYSEDSRHYHTMSHLENMYLQLEKVKSNITDWDAVLFALFYHDIVYNPSQSDNEEKSAVLARERLLELSLPQEQLEKCIEMILATKGHLPSSDSDTNYFTDADLSILGQPWGLYSVYMKQLRKEYAIYSDTVFNAGRKKVLAHFLGMDRIYKTDQFHDRFEKQAKENVRAEWQLL